MFIVFTQVFNWTLTFGSCLTLLFLFLKRHDFYQNDLTIKKSSGILEIIFTADGNFNRENSIEIPVESTWKFPMFHGFSHDRLASIDTGTRCEAFCWKPGSFFWPWIAMKRREKCGVFQMESMGGSRQFHPIFTLFQHFTSVIFVSMYFHLHRNSEILVVIYPRETAKNLRYIMPCLNSV